MNNALRHRRWRHRLVHLLMAVAVGACLLAAVGAAPATAVLTEVSTGSGQVTIGAQPRSTELLTAGAPLATFDNAAGNPVMHSNATYAVYWDPRYYYHGDWQHLIDTFLQNVGAASGARGNVFSVDTQYTDKSNQRAAYASTFRGAYTDTKEYPTTENCHDPDTLGGYTDKEAQRDNVACVTDTQIRSELQAFVAQNKLQTGMGTVFVVLTPPGVTVCADMGGALSSHCSDTLGSPNGFCSYHAAISPTSPVEGDSETVLYAVIPWSAGGEGDFHLADHRSGYECQDGGWDPDGKGGEEQEEAMSPPEAPHQQEPNQLIQTRGPDGSFDTGLADPIVNQVAVELQNTITDPLLDAWHDAAGNEAVDECRNFFALTLGGEAKAQEGTEAGTLYNQSIGSGQYYLNDAFDLAALLQDFPGIGCVPGVRLEPQFTAPNPVNAGDIVGFDASESTITLDAGAGYNAKGEQFETFPTYTWDFGDGTHTTSTYPPGASQVDEPSVYHSYRYGGSYDVTLTVTDVGGDTATVSHTITVDGPAPPVTSTPGVLAPVGGASPTVVGGPTVVGAAPTATGPTLTQSVLSRSLSKAANVGLAVHYDVDEQVAGQVEVLLASSTAAKLGVKARAAFGLPRGYPRSVVVGSALLVTQRAGQGTLRIKFAKAIARKLSKAKQLKLTLRFALRSASHPPVSTTELSPVVLSK